MKRLLFLCIGNAARSQMAEGFARHLINNKVEIFSAGSRPADKVEPFAIEVMKEKNIDISQATSKGFDKIQPGHIDYVVSMGCGDVCPAVPSSHYIEWHIPDPKGKNLKYFRTIRDKIEHQVKELLKLIRE